MRHGQLSVKNTGMDLPSKSLGLRLTWRLGCGAASVCAGPPLPAHARAGVDASTHMAKHVIPGVRPGPSVAMFHVATVCAWHCALSSGEMACLMAMEFTDFSTPSMLPSPISPGRRAGGKKLKLVGPRPRPIPGSFGLVPRRLLSQGPYLSLPPGRLRIKRPRRTWV